MNEAMETGLYWISQDIISLRAIKDAKGTEEEKAEVMAMGVEAMVFKMEDSGLIDKLSGAERDLFKQIVTLSIEALSGTVTPK